MIQNNPPQELQPQSGKPGKPITNIRKYVNIISAIIIIIFIIWATIFTWGAIFPPNGDPIGTVRAAYDALNEYDAKGVYDFTVLKFVNSTEYSSQMALMEVNIDAFKSLGIQYVISYVNVKNSLQMTDAEKSSFAIFINNVVDRWGIDEVVRDYCSVSYTLTTIDGQGVPSGGVVKNDPLFMIQGRWYQAESSFWLA